MQFIVAHKIAQLIRLACWSKDNVFFKCMQYSQWMKTSPQKGATWGTDARHNKIDANYERTCENSIAYYKS